MKNEMASLLVTVQRARMGSTAASFFIYFNQKQRHSAVEKA